MSDFGYAGVAVSKPLMSSSGRLLTLSIKHCWTETFFDRKNDQMKILYAALFLISNLFSNSLSAETAAEASHSVQQIVAHRGASSDRPEGTLCALQQAIEIGATTVEIDVRTSKDGVLFLLHDATVDRTTNGQGPASALTMAELKKLDAGSWFDEKYRGEQIPTLREALQLCSGKINVLLDLKEQGDQYNKAVSQEVLNFGDPQRTLVGVRSVSQAKQFRRLLPKAQQLGFIPGPDQIDDFAKAGVEIIRLWPKWLSGHRDDKLVKQIRTHGLQLHLNGKTGELQETLSLLRYKPYAILVDDPAKLITTLVEIRKNEKSFSTLNAVIASVEGTNILPGITKVDTKTFLNREYKIQQVPEEFIGQPRYVFDGGSGDRVTINFKKPTVVFAAFQYNDTGAWSFPDGRSPADFGWKQLQKEAYRGSSNGNLKGGKHFASIYYCQFDAGEQLTGLPKWWVCLAVMEAHQATKIAGYQPNTSGPIKVEKPFSYEQWATKKHPLAVPSFQNKSQWTAWQQKLREEFKQRLVFAYPGKMEIVAVGDSIDRGKFTQQEFHVHHNEIRIFRFYRLTPHVAKKKSVPTIVCFMGHGKVKQVLEEQNSYQHACAAQFAEKGYLVFAMENVGMEPGRDTHHELDRLLRLDGYCWYSLLFSHQQILLERVFADKQVDVARVAVTGVSTGGLLALSAAAFEPRVSATSVQGIFGSMRISFIQDRNYHCPCGAIPGLLPQFDLPEMALLVTPRPIHISNAVKDGFSPREAKRSIKLISPVYQQAGGPAPQFSEPPGSHEFAFEPALKFFKETLGAPQ